MKKLLPILCTLIGFFCHHSITVASEQPIIRETTEWCDVWMPRTNEKKLPRVLLIGDSITRGYYPSVEKILQQSACVARICTSKSVGDPALLEELRTFISQDCFDVIHFNNGMHGWGYSEEQYASAYPEIIEAIRAAAPNAKLIIASTTPVDEVKIKNTSNARVAARNMIATSVAAKNNIPVDDLFALMKDHPELHSDGIHFNGQGQSMQADQVAKSILPLLPHAH